MTALVAALLAVLVAGCAAPAAPPAAPAPSGPSVLVGPERFAQAIAEPDRLVVNVHVPFEGSLPMTDLDVPYDRVETAVAQGVLPADRSRPLALYCRSGPMSAEAATTLARLGYTDIVELDGGMRAWTASGRPLLPTPAPTS